MLEFALTALLAFWLMDRWDSRRKQRSQKKQWEDEIRQNHFPHPLHASDHEIVDYVNHPPSIRLLCRYRDLCIEMGQKKRIKRIPHNEGNIVDFKSWMDIW